MNRIQQAIDEIAARNENEPDVLKELKVLEDHIYEIESKMKSLFKDVCVDQKTKRNEAQFTVAARACSIVGFSIEDMREIEVEK